MPELPEVETVVRGLEARLPGRALVWVESRRPDLRFPLPQGFAARLTGRRVLGVARRAKYILVHLDGGLVWMVHLGMSGRLVLGNGSAAPPALHEHVSVRCDDGTTLTYRDPRRFGMMDLVEAGALADHPLLRHLGIEPLTEAFTGPVLAALFRGRRTSVKAALMDQRLVVGVGNIYACEALYQARLSPARLAGTVVGARAARLVAAIKAVLTRAIAAGGSSLRDYVQASGEDGYFQHQWAVYDRAGEPCPACDCGGGIRRMTQGARSTFYCPVRQR
ncbi:MAG: bifunctional DNA-formamidopyrimidine glycosylase/DNA-(apurinic or apyrimidinic site) lyase [Alphaproteobacteria bacterium]|nr:bifunctional DNA-formamidopyrimidine glycosylase/DNA-(apurinic or apyrimidinic site) lyase [Alphaproteobacteria bacterium]